MALPNPLTLSHQRPNPSRGYYHRACGCNARLNAIGWASEHRTSLICVETGDLCEGIQLGTKEEQLWEGKH
eukprot:4912005-Pyramimonas_sp.AAC.1